MKTGIYLLLMGIVCYFSNVVLIKYYLKKKVPFVLESNDKFSDGEHLWEKTAVLGIVPKWVSLIGLTALPLIGVGMLIVIISWFS